MTLINTHSALYWRQKNALLNFKLDSKEDLLNSGYDLQLLTTVNKLNLVLPVTEEPDAMAYTSGHRCRIWLNGESLEICAGKYQGS